MCKFYRHITRNDDIARFCHETRREKTLDRKTHESSVKFSQSLARYNERKEKKSDLKMKLVFFNALSELLKYLHALGQRAKMQVL